MKKNLFIAVSLLFFLWAGNYSFAQSSSSVTVTPITANYSATPPTVTFEVSWPAGSRNADHRAKVWVLVDYRRIQNNAYVGGWLRAGISSAHTPTTNSGTVSLDPGNTKGFWLQGTDGDFAATVTVPVTVDLTGYAPEFGWCGVASDRPPYAEEKTGYYILHGTPDFIIQTHPTDASQTVTEHTTAYNDCIYALTDSTGAPGETPLPAITGFNASAITICTGQSVTLTATATNAERYSFDNGVTWGSSSTTVVTPTSATTYTLKVTREKGACTVTFPTQITVTMNDPPTPHSLTANQLTVCPGKPATLTASATGAASYSLNGSTWTESEQLVDSPTTTTTYTLYIKSAAGCTASLPDVATVTVHPVFSPGAITDATGTTSAGTDPNVTIANSTAASGGDGTITYQWRRSGTSSATLSYNASTYQLSNSTTNYSAVGTYTFRRYAHDGTCNTAWVASSGQYTLTVTVTPPPNAGTKTYTCGNQKWSEPVRIAECNKTSFTNDNMAAHCRSNNVNRVTIYYYNWRYVAAYGSTTMCPTPWRIPTRADFQTLVQCLGSSPTNGVYFPATAPWGGSLGGYASNNKVYETYRAYYWTGSRDGSYYNVYFFAVDDPSLDTNSSLEMRYGMQVRCVQ